MVVVCSGLTDCGFDDCPQREPGAARRAVAAGLDTNLDDAQDGDGDTDEASAEQGTDAEFLAARHLEVPNEASGKRHD